MAAWRAKWAPSEKFTLDRNEESRAECLGPPM